MSTDVNANEDADTQELENLFKGWLDVLLSALNEEGSHEQFRVAVYGLRWLYLILQKNNDNGGVLLTPPVLRPNLSSNDAILIRMGDKIQQLQLLIAQQQRKEAKDGEATECPIDEFDDTVEDLGIWCLLYLANPDR